MKEKKCVKEISDMQRDAQNVCTKKYKKEHTHESKK